ncbi:hypothetical protein F4780DRAFT_770361 [Xylariomycetidae sp. FL0641]|nr:hypothetical protein F4780DRAFT_770361 [Xylariomycetidae sp. FL0641]
MPGPIDPEPVPAADPPPVELPFDNTPPRSYIVGNQIVQLDINFRDKHVGGLSQIDILPIPGTEVVEEIFIDARQCDIDIKKITVSNCVVEATYQDPCDLVNVPTAYQWSAPHWGLRKHRMKPLLHHRRTEVSALDHDVRCCTPLDGSLRIKLPTHDQIKNMNQDSQKAAQQDLHMSADGTIGGYRISIPFKLKNTSDGLHFAGVNEADTRYPHVYTRHSIEPGTACSIFPCIDDPGSRNSWKISITCPRTLGEAFDQALTTQQQFKGNVAVNGNRKRKHGEEEPRKRDYGLTEEDKLLEMTVVCSGYLVDEVVNKDDETKKTMTFEVDRNKAAKHIGFAVGPFEHVDLWSEFRSEEDDTRLGVSAAKVHGYCLPGRAEEVRTTCAALVTAVDHFVLHFGRYPFESYKVCFVDDMVEDTVPLCAFSLASSRLLYPAEVMDTEIETTRTLVYSLASQWFGVNIVPNMKSDIWLVMGIAWFMTEYFMKILCGNNHFRYRMKTMADRLVEVDMRRPSLQDLGEHLYLGSFEVDFMNLKAPLVLFILDRRLSKSSGSAGISRIISRMVSKANTSGQASDEVLGSDAFRKACEKTGSTRLESFWNQWVIGSGCPRFDVFQRFNKKRLCVEMTVRQTQDIAAAKARPLDKNDFWRDVREEMHAVYAGELQGSFTGPMTIRIHEADGTPYEHIVEIRDEAAKSVKFEIPYNTKYKRLKRNRRQRERALANNATKGNDESQKDLYYLGDVLQHPDEIEDWEFRDWDEETEAKMDQESYEWIRMDADFEWICEMQTNLPPYMYTSQLQQDRDVAAQQDSMLFLHRSYSRTGAHPLVSTILTRTLLDPRYYYGIRVMAAEELPRHAVQEQVNFIGLKHLMKTFQYFFCRPGSITPKPNNFADKRQYFVQCTIPASIARVRGEDGTCPREAREFLLEQLVANDNSQNVYSDQLYICKLIRAIATSMVPDEKKAAKKQMPLSLSFGDAEDEEMLEEPVDSEPEEFRNRALEEIERYRRMDEYSPSFQNCFTIAALDALCTLMKPKVIPRDPLVFVQYLQDRTNDLVRIKACEALVELDMLSNPSFLRFFFCLMSTDPSPFMRDRLFKVFCRGIASIAIGEHADAKKQQPEAPKDGLDLVVEQDNSTMEARQKAKARKEDLTVALAALKEETTQDVRLHDAIWAALSEPVLTIAERIAMLELCSILVEEDPSMLLTFDYPTYWTASKDDTSIKGHRCVMKFKRHYKYKPRKEYPKKPTQSQPAPPKPEIKRTITLNVNKSGSFSAKPPTPGPSQASPPEAVPTKPSSTAPSKPSSPAPSKPQSTALSKPPGTTPSKPLSTAPAGSSKPLSAGPSKNPSTASSKPASVGIPKSSGMGPTKAPAAAAASGSTSSPKPLFSQKKTVTVGVSREPTPVLASRDDKGSKPEKLVRQEKVVKHRIQSPVRINSPGRTSSPAPSQERPTKLSQQAPKDSISVQAPVRPSIESTSSEPKVPGKSDSKVVSSKVNGFGHNSSHPGSGLLKAHKSLKRASTESEGPRPTKIVKLDTSRIKDRLSFLDKPPRPAGKPKMLVKVKFGAWHRLNKNHGRIKTPESGSIRATPKHPRPEKADKPEKLTTLNRQPSNSFGSPPAPASKPAGPSSSPPGSQLATSPSSSHTLGNSQSSSGGMVRKPLPGMGPRKPLPGGTSGGGSGGSGGGSGGGDRGERTSLPTAPSTSPPPPPPSSAAAAAPKPPGPNKIKFKLKGSS